MKKNQLIISMTISILLLLIFNGAAYSQVEINDTASGKIEYIEGHPCIPYVAPPTNLIADSITSSSAQLHATAPDGGLVSFYYKLLAAQTWTFAPGGIANALLANTRYQFYASTYKYVCGKYVSKTSAIDYFTTLAVASHSSINMSIYPNPGRGSQVVSFSLTQPGEVVVKLFDYTGRTMTMIDKETMPAGEHQIPLALDNAHIPAGLYFVRIETSFGATETRKIIVIK